MWILPVLATFSSFSLIPWGLCVSRWVRADHASAGGVAASSPSPGTAEAAAGASGRVGPWGELVCTPMSLQPPGDFSAVDDFKSWAGPHWRFMHYTQDQALSLFKSAGISDADARSPHSGVWTVNSDGVVFQPTKDFVLGLTPAARAAIYSVLDDFPENEAQRTPYSFRADELNEILAQSGLKPETQRLLRSLLYQQGDSVLFADIRTAMSQVTDHDEKVRLFKTICHRPSLRVELRVKSDTDINQLASYWRLGGRTEELRPLLTALAHVDGGGTIDITHLLPPFAEQHVYTFPSPTTDRTICHRDCHWTTLNFFNKTLNDRYTDPATVTRTFDKDFSPITGDPQFGDVILLVNQDNVLIHSATYLADDVVFTKNGGIFTQPWTYMKLPDLVTYYNTFTPTSQPLKVVMCRRKVPPTV